MRDLGFVRCVLDRCLFVKRAMVDGACHEHTWDELAAAAGWNPPCERRRRKLSAPKRFPARGFKRQLSAKQAPRKDEM